MDGVAIRPFQDGDAEAAADLVRPLAPGWLVNSTLIVHWLRGDPVAAHHRMWVAERDGRLVAWSSARFHWSAREPGAGEFWIGVGPDERGRGVGSQLFELAERHLLGHGARRLATFVTEGEEAGRRFLERRGFRETRREQLSALDPRSADLSQLDDFATARADEGFRVAPLRDLLDRPRDLHALYAEAAEDMPTDEPTGRLGFADWVRETLGNPLLDPDASMTVLHGERPVAFAWLLVDRDDGRAEHELTGTLRAYRGRGLARLAKVASIRWCAEHGVTELLTSNDAENAPMLAINDRLGYRPTYWVMEFARPV